MPLDPTNYATWTTFGDHPIFGDTKCRIDDWSHDPSLYSELDAYGQFLREWYVHVDPAPPTHEQVQIAEYDIKILASVCAEIEHVFGAIIYELVILDDFTVYIWVEHPRFSVNVWPACCRNREDTELFVVINESPDLESEHYCQTVKEVISTLYRAISP